MVAVRRVGHLPSCPVFDAAGESYRRYPVYRRDGAACVCAANHTGGGAYSPVVLTDAGALLSGAVGTGGYTKAIAAAIGMCGG